MCIGIPARVLAVDGLRAECRAFDGALRSVDLSLLGTQPPGTWLLVHLDTAREILDPERAEAIAAALQALAAVLAGDAAAGGFGDLESRPPQLPPHLRAAGEPCA